MRTSPDSVTVVVTDTTHVHRTVQVCPSVAGNTLCISMEGEHECSTVELDLPDAVAFAKGILRMVVEEVTDVSDAK